MVLGFEFIVLGYEYIISPNVVGTPQALKRHGHSMLVITVMSSGSSQDNAPGRIPAPEII